MIRTKQVTERIGEHEDFDIVASSHKAGETQIEAQRLQGCEILGLDSIFNDSADIGDTNLCSAQRHVLQFNYEILLQQGSCSLPCPLCKRHTLAFTLFRD